MAGNIQALCLGVQWNLKHTSVAELLSIPKTLRSAECAVSRVCLVPNIKLLSRH